MKEVVVVAATPFEVAPLKNFISLHGQLIDQNTYILGFVKIHILITGVSTFQTSYHLGRFLDRMVIDLAINAGVAGAFNPELVPGQVVEVIEEHFADIGAEEANGQFTDIHKLQLIDADTPPFQNGSLQNPKPMFGSLMSHAKGITVNTVHGYAPSIAAIRTKYDPDVETMEGAAFFHACLLQPVPFSQIRAISNFVEPRNRGNWKLPLAIANLNEVLTTIISTTLAT